MTTMNPLMARFADQPCLISPDQRARFEACIAAVAGHEHAAVMLSTASADADFWDCSEDPWMARFRPYTVVNGVLHIPVKGILLHDFPYQLFDWATGYEYIWQAFKRGCGDYATGTIRGIAFVEDTPGGMVAGCFDAVDKMVEMKEAVGVPVRAFAHESAYSAGYAIATVADHIVVSRTGGVGSIGVVTSHVDLSGALDKAGVRITFIASDPSKVEGNYTEPLADDAKARIQARIDELYGIFVAAVSRSRGLSADVIRGDLKAYCYTATQATSNGLADSIGSLEDALSAFAGFLDDPSTTEGEDDMADQAVKTVDQAVHDQAVADARTEGAREGATNERARINSIIACEPAQKRPVAAMTTAMDTDMSVEAATAFLAKMPEEAPVAASTDQGGGFEDAMKGGNPEVGAGDDDKGEKGSKPGARGAAALQLGAGSNLRGFDAAGKQ